MIQSRTRAGIPGAPAGRSKKTYRSFLARLREDSLRLTALTAELERGADAARSLASIRLFAHEVCGYAGVFAVGEVVIAAQALERAAVVAQAGNGDIDVWPALGNLRDLLGSVSEGMAQS